ncbi:hypothetical protein [Curtobacterium sp. CFBP9011]|uniref:hypothetical protein n=1 Tax=Curtobacterium sp. CFBP9011 TaxID=3096530 RepID=UPI002A6B7308|nr:hypothetical protein [Curtobacterium sp. CFBP9011]MDY1005711.1 hypothetical protein [Curtobacterium sp. CFBP9011]
MTAAARKLAMLIRSDELIFDHDCQVWRVHSTALVHDQVVLTIRNELGERLVLKVPLDATLPVPVTGTTEAQRTLLRGLPWWGFAIAIAVLSWVVEAPINGGLLILIVICWIIGALEMLTPPRGVR